MCPHKQLKKQIVGTTSWYACIQCGQKFQASEWDGKVQVRKISLDIPNSPRVLSRT